MSAVLAAFRYIMAINVKKWYGDNGESCHITRI